MEGRPPELYGIPISELQRICRISLRTAQRWKAGQTVVPQAARLVLSVLNDLGVLFPEWAGWTIRAGVLYSPEGWSVSVYDVLALPLLRLQLSTYQDENFRLRGLIEELDEQPAVDSWDLSQLSL